MPLWFDMHSYAELPLNLLPHQSNTQAEAVNITFSTLEDGLLFFHGQMPKETGAGQDYIALASERTGWDSAGRVRIQSFLVGNVLLVQQ